MSDNTGFEVRIKRLEKQTDELIEFKGLVGGAMEFIKKELYEIKNNHLYHLNKKLNGLLFVVLASVFSAILIGLIKFLFK